VNAWYLLTGAKTRRTSGQHRRKTGMARSWRRQAWRAKTHLIKTATLSNASITRTTRKARHHTTLPRGRAVLWPVTRHGLHERGGHQHTVRSRKRCGRRQTPSLHR